MAYFAKIDENDIVTEVIVADQKIIDSGKFGSSSSWIETFRRGVGGALGKKKLRYNDASVGMTYDRVNDAFISINPAKHASWTLDANFQWQPPVAMPLNGEPQDWDDDAQKWICTINPLEPITISRVQFQMSSWSRAAGGVLAVRLTWVEEVTVTGNPTLVVTNDTRTNHTLTYIAKKGRNTLFTLPIAANNSAIQAGDVLSIATQDVVLADSSTIQFIDMKTGIPKDGTLTLTAAVIAATAGTVTATK